MKARRRFAMGRLAKDARRLARRHDVIVLPYSDPAARGIHGFVSPVIPRPLVLYGADITAAELRRSVRDVARETRSPIGTGCVS